MVAQDLKAGVSLPKLVLLLPEDMRKVCQASAGQVESQGRHLEAS